MTHVRYAFREAFKLQSKESIQWYPGHMDKSFTKMQSKIKQVDCVLEVHDARIPFSGRNPNFVKRLMGPKPHILVLNKKDLVSKSTLKIIDKKIHDEVDNVIYTNCKDQMCRGLKQLVPRAIDLISGSNRFNRSEETKLRIMVIGVPNVGKSSLINAIRNRVLHRGKATAVGAIAGVTRAIQNEVRISYEPPMFLLDTPGILPPRIGDTETGMKLALCSCLNDDVVGIYQIADFLLYWCNRHRIFKYVDLFELDGPCDDITKVLMHLANRRGVTKKIKDIANNSVRVVPDLYSAASVMVRAFRSGEFGHVSLDVPVGEQRDNISSDKHNDTDDSSPNELPNKCAQ